MRNPGKAGTRQSRPPVPQLLSSQPDACQSSLANFPRWSAPPSTPDHPRVGRRRVADRRRVMSWSVYPRHRAQADGVGEKRSRPVVRSPRPQHGWPGRSRPADVRPEPIVLPSAAEEQEIFGTQTCQIHPHPRRAGPAPRTAQAVDNRLKHPTRTRSARILHTIPSPCTYISQPLAPPLEATRRRPPERSADRSRCCASQVKLSGRLRFPADVRSPSLSPGANAERGCSLSGGLPYGGGGVDTSGHTKEEQPQ